jgi:sulfur relay (sulfurtransferase) DsrF/TusC family protein
LIASSISSTYIDGTGCFRHNPLAYQSRVYEGLGILLAMAFVHGGGSVRLFGNSVYNFLCGMDPSMINADVNEVSDGHVRDFL